MAALRDQSSSAVGCMAVEEAETTGPAVRTAVVAVMIDWIAKVVVGCMRNAGWRADSIHMNLAVGSHSLVVRTFDLDLAPAAPSALHSGAYS